jgi:hypothetical protein
MSRTWKSIRSLALPGLLLIPLALGLSTGGSKASADVLPHPIAINVANQLPCSPVNDGNENTGQGDLGNEQTGNCDQGNGNTADNSLGNANGAGADPSCPLASKPKNKC